MNLTTPVFNISISEHTEATFLSIYADRIWFHTCLSTLLMPYTNPEMDMARMKKNYSGWSAYKPGLWFLPNEYKHIVPLRLLVESADVQLIFASEQRDGLICPGQAVRIAK